MHILIAGAAGHREDPEEGATDPHWISSGEAPLEGQGAENDEGIRGPRAGRGRRGRGLLRAVLGMVRALLQRWGVTWRF